MTTEKRWWQHWDSDEERKKIEAYWRHAADQPVRRQHFYDVLRKELKPFPSGTRLLDFGCGTGEDTGAIVALEVNYTGVDVTPAMLAQARARFPSLRFEEDDMLASKYSDKAWPVVICNAVLPHLPFDRIATAIRELWRITEKLLIVRLFGVVRPEQGKRTVVIDGFIYQRWPKEEWLENFQLYASGAVLRCYVGKRKDTVDCLVICCQR